MQLFPAIDLREGATVQLVGGDPTHEAFHDNDPVKVALKWVEKGAAALHIVDLDAALGSGDNTWVLDKIMRALPQPVQVGGGVRSLLDIQKRLEMGVGRVIVGTQGIKEPLWLEEAARLYPGKILLAIDARGDEVAIKGWQEGSGLTLATVLDRVKDLPLAGLLYTNIDVEGRMVGVDVDQIRAVMDLTDHKLIVSGGIGSMDDLDKLKDLGVEGAVLGMSIYTDRIDLKAAIERIEGRTVETGRAVEIPKHEVQWGTIPEGTPETKVIGAVHGTTKLDALGTDDEGLAGHLADIDADGSELDPRTHEPTDEEHEAWLEEQRRAQAIGIDPKGIDPTDIQHQPSETNDATINEASKPTTPGAKLWGRRRKANKAPDASNDTSQDKSPEDHA